MPAVKSRNRLPSTSVTQQPWPRSITNGYERVKLGDIALASRAMSSAALGTGRGVVGWARLLPWKQRGFDVVECLVYVDPVHHGRGIGDALLKELTREARGLGYLTIVASVAKDNRAGLALFTKQGFEVVGTIRNAAHKFDQWMDITLVQKELET